MKECQRTVGSRLPFEGHNNVVKCIFAYIVVETRLPIKIVSDGPVVVIDCGPLVGGPVCPIRYVLFLFVQLRNRATKLYYFAPSLRLEIFDARGQNLPNSSNLKVAQFEPQKLGFARRDIRGINNQESGLVKHS